MLKILRPRGIRSLKFVPSSGPGAFFPGVFLSGALPPGRYEGHWSPDRVRGVLVPGKLWGHSFSFKMGRHLFPINLWGHSYPANIQGLSFPNKAGGIHFLFLYDTIFWLPRFLFFYGAIFSGYQACYLFLYDAIFLVQFEKNRKFCNKYKAF